MEILWPSKTPELNRKWMKCDRQGDPWTRLLARIKRDHPLELKEDCPYTATLSVAHLLGTFDPDVERAIRNKAVFYGAGFDAATDRVISPTYHDLPGVYLHAMAYDNLVSLGKDYKRADRLAWPRPTWRGAMADIGLLVALIVLWVLAGDASRPRPLVDRSAPDEAAQAPKAFVDRLTLTILLGAGALALIRSGKLASEGAVLLTLLVGYWAYKVLLKKDGLFLIASVLMAMAAVGSSYLLNLGPRNVIGYLAFFEITRHLTEHLDRGAKRYIRFREDLPADSEWGIWARWRPWLDSIIGVWLRGRVQGGWHDEAHAAHP